ncbi:hypothetical protein B484DRAFT_390686 [Ochromonadaceae sp. CCMP2298]|nr:hypothetical protein B484DRAFT_390686 [Ochromonadaceae sp. CCMP2298]
MGSGASMAKPDGAKIHMMSARAINKVRRLKPHEQPEFWAQFVEFVKGETWLVKICTKTEASRKTRHSSLHDLEFALPEGVLSVESAFNRNFIRSSKSSQGSPPKRESPLARRLSSELTEVSVDYIEEALTAEQRLVCLYGILLPHFLDSGHYDEFKRAMRERSMGDSRSGSSSVFMDRKLSTLSDASGLTTMLDDTKGEQAEQTRAGHMLLTAASYYDESEMVARFMKPQMLSAVESLVQKLPYAMFVLPGYSHSMLSLIHCDILAMPLLYVNSAFTQATQYTEGRRLPLRALCGADTESAQLQLVVEALEASDVAKVVLTLYRKNGTKFTAGLVLRPVFDLSGNCTHTMGFLMDGLSALGKMHDLTALLPQLLCRPKGY